MVFKIKSVTFLGFVAEAAEGKPGAALLALASLGPDQTIPTMIEDIDPDLRVVVLAGAEPTAADLSKLRFGASSPVRDDFGALLIHGGAPHVRATSPAGAVLDAPRRWPASREGDRRRRLVCDLARRGSRRGRDLAGDCRDFGELIPGAPRGAGALGAGGAPSWRRSPRRRRRAFVAPEPSAPAARLRGAGALGAGGEPTDRGALDASGEPSIRKSSRALSWSSSSKAYPSSALPPRALRAIPAPRCSRSRASAFGLPRDQFPEDVKAEEQRADERQPVPGMYRADGRGTLLPI